MANCLETWGNVTSETLSSSSSSSYTAGLTGHWLSHLVVQRNRQNECTYTSKRNVQSNCADASFNHSSSTERDNTIATSQLVDDSFGPQQKKCEVPILSKFTAHPRFTPPYHLSASKWLSRTKKKKKKTRHDVVDCRRVSPAWSKIEHLVPIMILITRIAGKHKFPLVALLAKCIVLLSSFTSFVNGTKKYIILLDIRLPSADVDRRWGDSGPRHSGWNPRCFVAGLVLANE